MIPQGQMSDEWNVNPEGGGIAVGGPGLLDATVQASPVTPSPVVNAPIAQGQPGGFPTVEAPSTLDYMLGGALGGRHLVNKMSQRYQMAKGRQAAMYFMDQLGVVPNDSPEPSTFPGMGMRGLKPIRQEEWLTLTMQTDPSLLNNQAFVNAMAKITDDYNKRASGLAKALFAQHQTTGQPFGEEVHQAMKWFGLGGYVRPVTKPATSARGEHFAGDNRRETGEQLYFVPAWDAIKKGRQKRYEAEATFDIDVDKASATAQAKEATKTDWVDVPQPDGSTIKQLVTRGDHMGGGKHGKGKQPWRQRTVGLLDPGVAPQRGNGIHLPQSLKQRRNLQENRLNNITQARASFEKDSMVGVFNHLNPTFLKFQATVEQAKKTPKEQRGPMLYNALRMFVQMSENAPSVVREEEMRAVSAAQALFRQWANKVDALAKQGYPVDNTFLDGMLQAAMSVYMPIEQEYAKTYHHWKDMVTRHYQGEVPPEDVVGRWRGLRNYRFTPDK